ncbi:hypothetical protein BOTBODRAFT_512587 [Botryobasidium botryosum FD-172 SS1]|uniref:Uncharacterized protein n=1 Tax=Botryobasidium botryosum (strain FD-172 SS1) TaxID=930990 RepID=A0A067MUT6_BOTB1|nr:hypothetical protein BOTBODRAFT_512587 [Botryobasidium botryosum FD-172 SS1]
MVWKSRYGVQQLRAPCITRGKGYSGSLGSMRVCVVVCGVGSVVGEESREVIRYVPTIREWYVRGDWECAPTPYPLGIVINEELVCLVMGGGGDPLNAIDAVRLNVRNRLCERCKVACAP